MVWSNLHWRRMPVATARPSLRASSPLRRCPVFRVPLRTALYRLLVAASSARSAACWRPAPTGFDKRRATIVRVAAIIARASGNPKRPLVHSVPMHSGVGASAAISSGRIADRTGRTGTAGRAFPKAVLRNARDGIAWTVQIRSSGNSPELTKSCPWQLSHSSLLREIVERTDYRDAAHLLADISHQAQ